ncbi:protein kinase domain-containing protein [Citrus sinensis]|uniref:Protein kinase domain-containing protein n=1 Tax=Citrus sinensis TaxID=2711 RepID=A0ACB8LZK3_CITSI|nr:protein kinase domain-containing protein [Citrus sinensis]
MTTLNDLTTDQSSLLAFKAHAFDYRSALANNWSISYPICSWAGISCGSRHQRVTALNLSDMGLGGTIPLHFGNLSFLVSLDISENNFHGHLPKELGQLRRLRVMSLAYNKLSGSFPSWIGVLSKLRILRLDYNNFTGPIPNSLFNLSRLEMLRAEFNIIGGTIPSRIGNLRKLVNLGLWSCNLQGQIPTEIGSLQNLKNLDLADNKLSGLIPPTIFNISTMRILTLESNQLSGRLPSTIGHSLRNIEYLALSTNNLIGKIPNSITNATKLIGLDLGFNSFSGHIPNTFGNLRHLSVLNVMMNNLTTESSSADQWSFLSSLTNCRNLSNLALASNPLGTLQQLQGFYVPENNLQGYVPHDLCHLERLNILNLSGNKLSGHIPPCLASLTSLRELHLGSNKLSSSIPSSLWSLEYILMINLSSNSLNDSLPSNIQKLKVLRVLDLSRNQLSGDIPSTIGALVDLEILSLASNQFQGPIPESVGSLISLESLDLSGNNLSGKIPKSLETLSHLKQFNVSHNRLEGCRKRSTKKSDHEDFLPLATWRRTSYLDIQRATDEFNECNLLGTGSFGSVYKGTISNGTYVAIKIFNLQLERAFRSFDSECEVLRNVRHRNLIKIISSCSNPDFKALVLEFMPNGEGEDSVTQTTTMATIGYMAPEYGSEGIVSAKCDVYSYGVLLMETFTRKRPTDEMFTGEMSLRRWVKESLPHRLSEVVDTNLVREEQAFSAKMDCLLSIMDLALDCCMESPDKRMHMTDAAAKLKKIKVKFLDDVAASS